MNSNDQDLFRLRIAFLAPCLEPSKSGVGDYTLLLAQELCRTGHRCLLIALNDSWSDVEEVETVSTVPMLRFPSFTPWKNRFEKVENAIKDFDPDWVSLQFVCYGYDPKGLIWGLANRLRRLCAGRNVHVMFHELWIGESRGAALKHRLVGRIQKWLVLDLLHKLCPSVVHANCSTYVELLRRNKVTAERLPLFGSIPIAVGNADRCLCPAITPGGLKISRKNRSKFWLFGVFGSLHPQWDAEPLFSYIMDAARAENVTVAIIAIGQKGLAGDLLWGELTYLYRDRLHFLDLGEQTAQMVSEVFLSLDFGIAATPAALIGKSASVTAMLEHGLPVIVTRDDYLLDVPFEPEEFKNPMLVRLTPSLVKNLAGLKRHPPESKREAVAKQLLGAIGSRPESKALKSPSGKSRFPA